MLRKDIKKKKKAQHRYRNINYPSEKRTQLLIGSEP